MDPQALSQLLGYPLAEPPPGVTPNFDNPESLAYQIYITVGVCIPLMLVFALFRGASVIYLGRKVVVGEEMVFIIGLVLCLAFTAATIACVSAGAIGIHAWNLLLGALTKPMLVLALLLEILMPLAICFVKISILILYLQIFRVLKWMRLISIGGIIIIAIFHISMAISFAIKCAPYTGSGHLDFLAAFVSDTCSSIGSLMVVQGVVNVVIDIFLLILPLPAIWALQMPMKRKLAVSSMFLVGLCACASSIIGLAYRVRYFSLGGDRIFVVVPVWATTIAEETAGIMIYCMPTTAAVFKAAKEPVRTWLSSVSERTQHLKGPSRSSILLSRSNSNLRDAQELVELEGHLDPIYYHTSPHDRDTTWAGTGVNTEVNTYSLLQPNAENTDTGKKEINIVQAV